MYLKVTYFFLFIMRATVGFETTNILDLLSLNLDDSSEVIQREVPNDSVVQVCNCTGSLCKCCVDFDVVFIDFGGPGCVYMKYVSQVEGIDVNVTYGKSILHTMQVKGPNPDLTCIPLLEDLAEVCTQFTNLYPVDKGFKGCLKLHPKLLGQIQTQFNVGCFTIGSEGMRFDNMVNLTQSSALTANLSTVYDKPEAEEFNEEELIATVNETAEKGLAFFGNWLGIFKKQVVELNTESIAATDHDVESSTVDVVEEARAFSTITGVNKVL